MFKLPLFGLNKRKNTSNNSPSRGNVKMVVGLGNPEDKYTNTYHNIGFAYINSLTSESMKKYQDFAFVKKDNLVIVKPLTFMNQSGKALKQALRYFKLKPYQMIVAHDDSDLTIGEHKIVYGRGSAGHKGVQSIINHLKTKDFFRLRIGVRSKEGKAGDFILKKLNQSDQTKLEELFSKIQVFDDSFQSKA